MRLIFVYAATAIVAITAAIFAISPFASSFVEEWSRRDVELRAALVFNSVRDDLTQQLSRHAGEQISGLFERLAMDERLLAAGYCDRQGALRYKSKLMPVAFSCEKVARSATASFSSITADGHRVVAGSFPITTADGRGHLILLHDLSFAARRGAQAQTWIVIALAAVALVGAALASAAALLIVRRWLQSIRRTIEDLRWGRIDSAAPGREPAFGREIHRLLREINETRRSFDASHVEWSPQTLQQMVARQLPNAQIIVVSNREPYIHNSAAGEVSLQIPASGLVAAIEPVMRACGGTWIAHGSGSADRETVDAQDRLRVPPSSPCYALRRVWLSDEEQDGYYYGLANEGLWPLCHIAFVRPTFRESDWRQYRDVNARFAEAVVEEANCPDPIVLVQDYHFALLPKMVREELPQATIITFWHIPWPNAETFGLCPWKNELVEGLLGSTVLGFHTQFHCNNFVDTVDRFLESRIDRELASVTMGGHETFVRSYPISIEWPPAALAGQKPIEECRIAVRERLGLGRDILLGVGIERFDYTKGILDRMRAVDSLLTAHPEWRGRFVFVQVAAPSRSKLQGYRDLQEEARRLAEEINGRHGIGTHRPIVLIIQHHEPQQVFELFRAADLCIVSSLHDGMNLVAKEFVAARDDERGVLILSTFAGASRELSEALIINPYDAHTTAEAIDKALRMSEAEQSERMRLMRSIVRERNVYRWAGQILLDAAQLRKRERVITLTSRDARDRERATRKHATKLRSTG